MGGLYWKGDGLYLIILEKECPFKKGCPFEKGSPFEKEGPF